MSSNFLKSKHYFPENDRFFLKKVFLEKGLSSEKGPPRGRSLAGI